MKKILLTSALVATSLFSFAQTPAVPNGGFENWSEALCGDEAPDEYITLADIILLDTDNCPTSTGIAKSTNKYSGTNALELSSAVFMEATVGNLLAIETEFNGRPTKLIGYTKFTKGGTDNLEAFVGLSNEDEDEIAYGEVIISATQSDYMKFEITLEYFQTATPTMMYIGFKLGTSVGESLTASASTSALIDALSFEYGTTTSTVNYAAKSPINVFAANKNINFSENVSDIHIVDMVGVNKMQEASSTKTVNAASLNSGLYIVTYNYNGNYFSKKVVIE